MYPTNRNEIVKIANSKIVLQLRNCKNSVQRGKLIKSFLIRELVGKELLKPLSNESLIVKERKSDIKELMWQEHLDTSLAMTKIIEMLMKSEFLEEEDIKTHKKMDHFWYLRVYVEIDKHIYCYVLNIGRNKFDGNISIYKITNYKKRCEPKPLFEHGGHHT